MIDMLYCYFSLKIDRYLKTTNSAKLIRSKGAFKVSPSCLGVVTCWVHPHVFYQRKQRKHTTKNIPKLQLTTFPPHPPPKKTSRYAKHLLKISIYTFLSKTKESTTFSQNTGFFTEEQRSERWPQRRGRIPQGPIPKLSRRCLQTPAGLWFHMLK